MPARISILSLPESTIWRDHADSNSVIIVVAEFSRSNPMFLVRLLRKNTARNDMRIMYNQTMTDEQLTNLPREKLAMLIDGDNAQPSLLPQMLVDKVCDGQVTVRRIYGDWTTANMNSWKETLNFHAFQPIQQFRYTIGKNATDSAMIIDAMDILHSGVVDAFCLVSSDSDYTRLATRIRVDGNFSDGHRREINAKAFRQRLRRVRLHRKFGGWDESRTSPIIAAKINIQSETQKRSRPDAFAGASLRYGGSRGRLGAARLDGQRVFINSTRASTRGHTDSVNSRG